MIVMKAKSVDFVCYRIKVATFPKKMLPLQTEKKESHVQIQGDRDC